MLQVPQSTARVVLLKLFLTGTTTAATGKTVAVTLSKNGGAFANPAAGATNAAEVASGWYSVSLGAGDTDTLGDLIVRGTATGCDDSERGLGVVDAASGGLTNLDASVNSRSTYAGADTAGTATLLTRVTAAVLLASAYTAPDNAGVAAIKAKTDNLPDDPADQSLVIGATNAIMTRLGVPAVTIAADIATLLPAASYVAPDNAGIAALIAAVADVPTNAEFAAAVALLGTSAQLVKVLAAVYDSASVVGSVITLSNGATLTVTGSGRVRAGG